MSDERREAAVQRLERFTRIQGDDARRIVDMVIDAIEDGISDATPGPVAVAVSEAEVREALLVYGRVLREGTVWNKKLHAMRAALEGFLAARTTARAEPTDGWAAIESGSIERAEAENAARNAGEGVE